jgi:3-deoxy-D-manno-octulosonate 8-phosphate phosphatase (KDO 8-P phosphatase)
MPKGILYGEGRSSKLNGEEARQTPDVVIRQLAKVRLLAMDVDGVLTDGTLAYDDAGHEHKRFCVADGLGLVVLRHCEISTAWISGRHHEGVARRARELGITVNYQAVHDKRTAITEISRRLNVTLNEVAYIGDDWNDLPALQTVGCPIAVANATLEVKAAALVVTKRVGGHGAVREVCETIFDAQGLRTVAIERYLASLSAASPPLDQRVM